MPDPTPTPNWVTDYINGTAPVEPPVQAMATPGTATGAFAGASARAGTAGTAGSQGTPTQQGTQPATQPTTQEGELTSAYGMPASAYIQSWGTEGMTSGIVQAEVRDFYTHELKKQQVRRYIWTDGSVIDTVIDPTTGQEVIAKALQSAARKKARAAQNTSFTEAQTLANEGQRLKNQQAQYDYLATQAKDALATKQAQIDEQLRTGNTSLAKAKAEMEAANQQVSDWYTQQTLRLRGQELTSNERTTDINAAVDLGTTGANNALSMMQYIAPTGALRNMQALQNAVGRPGEPLPTMESNYAPMPFDPTTLATQITAQVLAGRSPAASAALGQVLPARTALPNLTVPEGLVANQQAATQGYIAGYDRLAPQSPAGYVAPGANNPGAPAGVWVPGQPMGPNAALYR